MSSVANSPVIDGKEESGNGGAKAISRACEMAYPRPQLQRRNWMSLNGRWKFTFDDEGRFARPSDIAERSSSTPKFRRPTFVG